MTGNNIFFDLAELKSLGRDSIIGRTVRIRKPKLCSVGHHTILDDFTYVSCGITVGDYTHIGANGVLIGGDAHITIGHFVNIAPGCRLIAASNDFSGGGLVGSTGIATGEFDAANGGGFVSMTGGFVSVNDGGFKSVLGCSRLQP